MFSRFPLRDDQFRSRYRGLPDFISPLPQTGMDISSDYISGFSAAIQGFKNGEIEIETYDDGSKHVKFNMPHEMYRKDDHETTTQPLDKED